MQQTETYQLNLIETSDNFSPEPLNQNTQKLEQALSAETAQRTAADAALDSRVTVLEGHKVYVGTYVGNDSILTVSLGFTPAAVIILTPSSAVAMATKDRPFHTNIVTIVEGGFRVQSQGATLNSGGGKYGFLAIK